MRNGQLIGLPQNNSTWILVATLKKAHIFQSDGGTKNLELNTEMDRPPHEDSSITHLLPLFADQLAQVIEKARARGEFTELVLVCEPKLLGQIRRRLDPSTLSLLRKTIPKAMNYIDEAQMKDRIRTWAF